MTTMSEPKLFWCVMRLRVPIGYRASDERRVNHEYLCDSCRTAEESKNETDAMAVANDQAGDPD
jgi:hypothetical protein